MTLRFPATATLFPLGDSSHRSLLQPDRAQTPAVMSHDLLHEALNRHAGQLRGRDGELLSPRFERLALSGSDDENELVEVRTPMTASVAGSVESTPASSRSASPSRAGANRKKGGAGKPRRDKAKEREKAEQMRNPIDPFLRFPGEVLGRVLGDLDVRDLLAVGLVCKRWRRSQTLSESAHASATPVSGVSRVVGRYL